MRTEVTIVPEVQELARAAAEAFFRSAAAAIADRGRFVVALSGGSTPRALYRLLADEGGGSAGRFSWSLVHFFWSDERHVPPEHPDSNYRMAREALLARIAVPEGNVHRIRGEEPDAHAAALAYE